jgi:DNA-binding transcriptional MerR regulator
VPSSASSNPDVPLTSRQAADACGIAPHVLRYYTMLGLIQGAGSTPSGRRLYPASVVRQVQTIRRLQRLGYSLRDIREIFLKRPATPPPQSR